jgi:signal transduction histidine kinase
MEGPGDTSEDIIGLLAWIGLPAILLSVGGGWWMMRKALAPVQALTHAAQLINEHHLGERLPRTGTGDEFDRLTDVFNAMTERLQQSFQRIREFTLHASHELKTPLTVMRGELETALNDEALPTTQRDGVQSQLDEIQRLTRIVDGLTLLTKADAGLIQLALKPVPLAELVRDCFADTQILAHAHGITVTLAACEQATVLGEAHRLRQLLLNLVDNAVKYNQPGGSITMALRRVAGARACLSAVTRVGTESCENRQPSKRDSMTDDRNSRAAAPLLPAEPLGAAEITIANTGPGIPPEALPRVFDRFFRGDPAHSAEVEGCGLGLSIAQWIVSVHNGTIGIDSVPSKMTTVTVRLPLVPEAPV